MCDGAWGLGGLGAATAATTRDASNSRVLEIPAVRHSLGVALAATALLVADSSPALAQLPVAQTQEPSRPAEPPAAAVEAAISEKWLSIGARPKSVLESWLSGAEVKCTGCRGFDTTLLGTETTDANAPWVLEGKWRRQTGFGNVSAGFIGVRNYAAPLSTAIPIGGDVDLRGLASSRSSVFAPVSQWSLTASVEKTLVKRASGATIGFVADALMPVATKSALVGDARTNALTSATIRAGIIFRW